MVETSLTLLQRLRERSDAAWTRFVYLYTPLIAIWLQRLSIQPHDCEDVRQEVFLKLQHALPDYDKRRGGFRAWLWGVVLNRVRVFRRKRGAIPVSSGESDFLDQLADPHSALSKQWDREHNRHLVRTACKALEHEWDPVRWRAICMVLFEGRDMKETADALGLTYGALSTAKSRLKKRLREELAGLIEV